MRRVEITILSLLAIAFAPAPFPKPLPRGSAEMQGDWTVQSWTMDDEKPVARKKGGPLESTILGDPSAGDGTVVRIKRDRLTFHLGSAVYREWVLELEPGSCPKKLGIREVDRGGSMQGIYKLEKDTLTICFACTGNERPTVFTRRSQELLILKRKRG